MASAALAVQAMGCDPGEGRASDSDAAAFPRPDASGKEDALAATGLLITGSGGTAGLGAAATACVASVGCGIAVAVVGLVVVGGVTLYAVHAANERDAALLRESSQVRLQLDQGTVELSTGYQNAYSQDYQRIVAGPDGTGISLGQRAVTSLERFAAVTYLWNCVAVAQEGTCLAKSRDFVSCASYGGGDTCWAPIGGKAQYVFAASSGTAEADDDEVCAGVATGSTTCGALRQRYKDWCGQDQFSELGCYTRNGRLAALPGNGAQPRSLTCEQISSMSFRAAMCFWGRTWFKHTCLDPSQWDDGHETPIEYAEDVYDGCMSLYQTKVPAFCSPIGDSDDRWDDLYDDAVNDYGC